MIIAGMHPPAPADTAFAAPPLPDALTQPHQVPLPDWGWFRAEGPDAASFLHGQLTQDVLHLPEGVARLAGYCTAKGRLLATLVLWREGPEAFGLACSRDLLEPTLRRLRMFVLRARCVLLEPAGRALGGVLGPVPALAGQATWAAVHGAGIRWIRLPEGRGPDSGPVEGTVIERALAVPDLGVALPDWPAGDRGLWDWTEVASAVPRVVAATADHFVPQMINFEVVGGVNFQKGCYPGQEVVARSQYRGTLKRRAFLLRSASPLTPGTEIFHRDDPDQPAGEVVLSAGHGGAHLALAELKIAATTQGSLHAGGASGPALALQPLPYALPADDR